MLSDLVKAHPTIFLCFTLPFYFLFIYFICFIFYLFISLVVIVGGGGGVVVGVCPPKVLTIQGLAFQNQPWYIPGVGPEKRCPAENPMPLQIICESRLTPRSYIWIKIKMSYSKLYSILSTFILFLNKFYNC